MYADDIILVTSKEEELKSIIGRFKKYLDKIKSLLEKRLKKANIVMRQVWGMTERKFKDDLKRRMMMIDSLVQFNGLD